VRPTVSAPTSIASSEAVSTPPPTSPTAQSSSASTGGRLPLGFSTGSATQVITATATSTADTEGLLQAWQRDGSGWVAVGGPVHAWFGTAGLTYQSSEHVAATPIGSFGITEAFGRDADPGTSLPYRRTTTADWWISQNGPLYNTEQHCPSACTFDTSKATVNENLYRAGTVYNYAVVIDIDRLPQPVYPDGSAYFLHVSVGVPTAGCVSIAEGDLVRILRWLKPSAHPRILIGIS
jgi:L,D-peptidoglycan transpeptidase YkuD (ErfK/YbiS/YcfS/YnhG family)